MTPVPPEAVEAGARGIENVTLRPWAQTSGVRDAIARRVVSAAVASGALVSRSEYERVLGERDEAIRVLARFAHGVEMFEASDGQPAIRMLDVNALRDEAREVLSRLASHLPERETG